jgi:molybdopterin/thiamine biosynthesis adenylyltransferase
MGVSRLTLVDPDRFDRSNVPRQLVLADGVGQPKAHALARALVPHMTNAGRIVAIARAFDPDTTLSWEMDAIAIGVDNNAARLYAADYAAKHKIPAAFAMLSQDGLRARIFLQTPEGPCLSCVLPDLDVGGAAPCAAAAITSCWLAASHAVAMLVDAIMSEGASRLPIWYEASLDGSTDRAARPKPNGDCGCHAERHLATT